MKPKSLAVLGVCTILVAGAYLMIASEEDNQLAQIDTDSVEQVSPELQSDGSEVQISQGNQLPYQSKHGSLVSSLEGIYFDRELAVDEAGNIRISSDLKDIFDFFFSAIEEEELEKVIARIDEYLAFKLDDPALTQARKILSDYVAYKSALYDFEIQQSEQIAHMASAELDSGQLYSGEYLNFVEQRQNAVTAMRNQFLGAEVHEAFFASSEQYDGYMLQKLKISSNKSLSDEQKSAMLSALDSQMPAEFIERRKQANPVAVLRTAVSSVEAESAEQVYAARAEAVGVEAADRLTTLDQQRAEWESRYQEYRSKRDQILSNSGLSAEDQNAQIRALQTSNFSDTEQVRVIALDQING